MNGGMKVFVGDISGQLIPYEVELSDTIRSLWSKIMHKLGFVDRKGMNLVFGGNDLEDGRTFADYNINPGSKINLTRRVGDG